MRIRFVLLCAALILPALCFADPSFEIGTSFATGFPVNSFRDNVDDTGYGMTVQVYHPISHTPFSVGGSLAFSIYGSHTTDTLLVTNPPTFFPVTTSNNILMMHFLFRYQQPPSLHTFRPYAEGLFGFNYLWTQTSLGNGSDQITSTNFDDSTLSAGVGGGVSICLTNGVRHGAPMDYSIDLNVGARYLFGGNAQYLTRGPIRTVDGDPVYGVSSSRTNLLVTNIGITFSF